MLVCVVIAVTGVAVNIIINHSREYHYMVNAIPIIRKTTMQNHMPKSTIIRGIKDTTYSSMPRHLVFLIHPLAPKGRKEPPFCQVNGH